MRGRVLAGLASLCVLVLTTPASAQVTIKSLSSLLGRNYALQQKYGECLFSELKSGTKIELADAVVDAALKSCRAAHEEVLAEKEAQLPVERRQAFREGMSKAEAGVERVSAVTLALYAHYGVFAKMAIVLNAGGQPAVSTAGSK